MTNTPLRVLIVDDSAYVRKVVRQMLTRSPRIEVVGAARDGAEALELAEQLQPDVITTDLVMPQMDGVAFVRAQMARRPLPIVVVSSADAHNQLALAALEAGAVDVVRKPTALASEQVFEIYDELIAKLQAATQAQLGAARPPLAPAPREPAQPARRPAPGGFEIVAIGISTGGPQALKQVIPLLPADFPAPIVIVLHMPLGFTELYARSLNQLSALHVAEAGPNTPLRAGQVLIAPAGQHLRLERAGPHSVLARLDTHPLDTPHRPAVDVLFQSAALAFQQRTLAIVMTGMGADGCAGAAWVKAQGGTVWTESAESCVIYGMPRTVVEAGLSDQALPLGSIARALCAGV